MAFFDPKYKLKVHILQIILIHIVMGVSAPQLFLKGQPRTRASTIALGMVSLVFIHMLSKAPKRPDLRWGNMNIDQLAAIGRQIDDHHRLPDFDRAP